MLEGFSDGHSINGSQETFCIKRKGFIMFLSYGHHKSTIMKNPSCGVLPSRQRIHIELYTEGVAPVTHGSAFQAPECLWDSFFLPRIGRIESYGEKNRSKSLLLSPGLRPCSLMRMLSHVSELPCPTLPICLVCPLADRKASKQNSCRRQYKISLQRRLLTVTSDL